MVRSLLADWDLDKVKKTIENARIRWFGRRSHCYIDLTDQTISQTAGRLGPQNLWKTIYFDRDLAQNLQKTNLFDRDLAQNLGKTNLFDRDLAQNLRITNFLTGALTKT